MSARLPLAFSSVQPLELRSACPPARPGTNRNKTASARIIQRLGYLKGASLIKDECNGRLDCLPLVRTRSAAAARFGICSGVGRVPRQAGDHGPYFLQSPEPSRCPMSELPALAQIMTSAVALMGARVAGLSVYFTYRGRHNQFRQVVYGRQMDAYFDIAESMSDLYTAAQNVLAAGNPWLKGEDARVRFRAAAARRSTSGSPRRSTAR